MSMSANRCAHKYTYTHWQQHTVGFIYISLYRSICSTVLYFNTCTFMQFLVWMWSCWNVYACNVHAYRFFGSLPKRELGQTTWYTIRNLFLLLFSAVNELSLSFCAVSAFFSHIHSRSDCCYCFYFVYIFLLLLLLLLKFYLLSTEH